MPKNHVWRSSSGEWSEALLLFDAMRSGEHALVARLLETSPRPMETVRLLGRLVAVYMRGENPVKIERFLEAGRRAGPPPSLPRGVPGRRIAEEQRN